MKKPLNLLLLWTDEHRPDALGCYGNADVKSPHLDRLASQSTVFERAYCTQPVCTPSRGSILTGLYPHTHGCTTNNIALKPETPTLAEMVDPIYHRAYMGKWHLGDEITAQHGFETWVSIEDEYRAHYRDPADLERFSDYHHYLIRHGFPPNRKLADGATIFSRDYAAVMAEPFTKAGFLGEVSSRFVTEQAGSDRPWLLSVNYLEPHMPFFGPLNADHDPEALGVNPVFAKAPPADAALKARILAARYQQEGFEGMPLKNESDWRRLLANYYGLVTMVDRSIGRILDALEASGQLEDTIVVYTSDHGEMMGNHGMLGKGVFYEPSVGVPLMIRVPGLAGGGGRRVSQPISQIDLLPTLLELMGQPVPGHVHGVSRAGVLRGDAMPDEPVFVEWNGGSGIPKAPVGDFDMAQLARARQQAWRSVIDGPWKANFSEDGEVELYDVASDPCEQRNRAGDADQRSRLGAMRGLIADWQQRFADAQALPA